MTALLQLLADDRTRRAAIALLRRAESQPVDSDGGYDYLHQLWRGHSSKVRDLARHAYAQANPDLGLGWRHRYCRAANWIIRERRRCWLRMPVKPRCARCYNRREPGHRTCATCRARRPR